VDREEEFEALKTAVDVAQRAKRDAEKAQERMTDEMKEAEDEMEETREDLIHMKEQEDFRRTELKKYIDGNADLELEVRQVTAQRDHARASILKLEEDHKMAASEAIKHEKKSKDLAKELREIRTEIASNQTARETVMAELVDTRENFYKSKVDKEAAQLDLKKAADDLEERDHELSTMKHAQRMWVEEKAENDVLLAREKASHYQIDTDNSILRSTVDDLSQKLEERKAQLTAIKAERKKLQGENAKIETELFHTKERLSIAQELEHIDLGQFNAMRQTNMDVASKIEKFLDATKGKMEFTDHQKKKMANKHEDSEEEEPNTPMTGRSALGASKVPPTVPEVPVPVAPDQGAV